MSTRTFVRLGLALMVVLLVSTGGAAWAQETKDGSSPPPGEVTAGCSAIVDDAYDGSIGSMTCLTVPGPVGAIEDLNVEMSFSHTWVGDLTIKLVSPSAEVLTLMSRPGLAEPADDGTSCCGSGNDMTGATITFDDSSVNSAESFGSVGSPICSVAGPCDYFPAPDTGPGTNLAQYIGQEGAGSWQVCIGDGAGADVGELCTANLVAVVSAPSILEIPTTNAWGLAALALLLATAAFLVLRRH